MEPLLPIQGKEMDLFFKNTHIKKKFSKEDEDEGYFLLASIKSRPVYIMDICFGRSCGTTARKVREEIKKERRKGRKGR